MAKRTKKQKQKGLEPKNSPTASCDQCGWEGFESQVIYPTSKNRPECPKCAPKNHSTDENSSYFDGYCVACEWRGPDFSLKLDPKTAVDRCPRCDSDNIEYLDWREIKKGATVKKPKSAYVPCYKSHPTLPLKDGLEIYGGSCVTPATTDCDIYIGFQQGMERTKRGLPWVPGEEVPYPIHDGRAPEDASEFTQLVEWTAAQLRDGKRVHAGCIGGHGRTGMFFAALVGHMGVSDDPIKYVRDNYCAKGVESREQVNFLMEHFNAADGKGSKESVGGKTIRKGLDTEVRKHKDWWSTTI